MKRYRVVSLLLTALGEIFSQDFPSFDFETECFCFNSATSLSSALILSNISKIKTIFNKSLQGSIGVIEERFIAEQRPDYKIRFFAKDEEIIHLTDGDIFVCSQWGILNIPQFIARANQLGFDIQEIKQ